MAHFWYEDKLVNLPLKEGVTALLRRSHRFKRMEGFTRFLDNFSGMSLEEQAEILKLSQDGVGNLLKVSRKLKKGSIGWFGCTHQINRSCEISSGSYSETHADIFRVGERKIYLLAQVRDRGALAVSPILDVQGNKHVNLFKFRSMLPFTTRSVRDGGIHLDYGCFGEGSADMKTGTQEKYRFQENVAHLYIDPKNIDNESLRKLDEGLKTR